jgi:hypothetical protein
MISRWIILRMRNFQNKVVEKIKTHILCSITFFRKSCLLWDNVEKYGTAGQTTDDNIIRRMRFGCWITKATHTHPEHVTLLALPPQQWLRERASVWRHMYSACLFFSFQRASRLVLPHSTSHSTAIEVAFPGVKANMASSVKVKNMWSHTSTVLYALLGYAGKTALLMSRHAQ